MTLRGPRTTIWEATAACIPALSMIAVILTGCAHREMTETLQVVPSSAEVSSAVVLDLRALVVGHHPAAVAQASHDLRRLGFTLIQQDRLQHILDEQDPHVNNPAAAHAYLVRRGWLSGAEVVVTVDVGGPKDSPTVIVKGIEVETGNVLWSGGIVSTSGASDDQYSRVIVDLTHRAVIDGFTKPQGGSAAVLLSHP